MGALRINRKRGDDYFTLNGKLPSLGSPNSSNLDERLDSHISKKQKTSFFSNPYPEQLLKSTASRLSRYPAPVNPIRREVHAPCRVLRFGSSAKSNGEGSAGKMGNCFSSRSPQERNIDFSRFENVKNVKEVIDVEAVSARDDVGGDSSMEDGENAEDPREWQPMVVDQSSEEAGGDALYLPSSKMYFTDEVKDKNGEQIDITSWEQEFVEDLPEQKNGWDCGVFMIKYADFYSRGLGLCFNQDHMPYFRRRTVKEILKLKAE